MKLQTSVTAIAERLPESARGLDLQTPPKREDFGARITRAVNERGILLGALTRKQHLVNVERERTRYRPNKRRKATASG